MIIEAIFDMILGLLEFVFSWLSLPGLPDVVQEVIDEVLAAMVSVVGIVGIFIDWDMVLILIPIVIAIVNLEKVWSLIMFVLRKIPFLDIE